MARASDPIDRFGRFLANSEHSPLTIKNYRSDLDAFAAWSEAANSEPMEPAKITPTDVRQFKRWLVEQRRLKPNAGNHKLATPKSFWTWATRAGFTNGLPVPAPGQAWRGPRPVAHEQPGPRWLDRREQNALLRAVERAGRSRDLGCPPAAQHRAEGPGAVHRDGEGYRRLRTQGPGFR